ncbi:MAG: phosphotransacetylase family protein [Armatimonadota bacterium]
MKVYVAATRQNDGKTIASVGLIAALTRRLEKVGYIKPVGQHYVEVRGHKVDEDAVLIKETYKCDCPLPCMSPVAVPRGFTETYIEHPHRDALVREVRDAYEAVSAGKDFVLIEGTGHAGVGSVFDMSNADVAAMLGAKVLLIAAGGLGRPIDEIMLNKAVFDQAGVQVVGVIINKVQEDKYDKINRLVRKGLARKGIEVLGVMPYKPVLTNPTLEQLIDDVEGELLSGKDQLKTEVRKVIIGAMPPHDALRYLGKNTLLITPGTREDLILAALGSHVVGEGSDSSVAGIVLTGGVLPHRRVMELIHRANIPVIRVAGDTFRAATKIHSVMVKLRPGDTRKIHAAERLVQQYVDIDRLLELLKES